MFSEMVTLFEAEKIDEAARKAVEYRATGAWSGGWASAEWHVGEGGGR